MEIRLNNSVDKSSMRPRMPNTRLRNKLILLEIRPMNLAKTSRRKLKRLEIKLQTAPRIPRKRLKRKLMLLEIRLMN